MHSSTYDVFFHKILTHTFRSNSGHPLITDHENKYWNAFVSVLYVSIQINTQKTEHIEKKRLIDWKLTRVRTSDFVQSKKFIIISNRRGQN
jgi:hypothetical protein